MLPKCSIVSIGLHDEVLNWVAKYKPVSIVVVNERGQSRPERPWENSEIDGIRRAMNASPKTLWIMRSWPDGIDEGDTSLWSRLYTCFKPFMDMPNPKMGHSYNEPGFPWIQASGNARWFADVERQVAESLHGASLLSLNFCFSESHILKGNLGLWEIYAEALPYVDALGFNEYDKVGSDTWGELWREHDFLYRLGHWEEQRERIIKVLGYCPPIILGEGLIDGKVRGGAQQGWSKLGWSDVQYLALHQAVHDASYHKPGLFTHHTFCYAGKESEWHRDGYAINSILDDLGKLIQNQVYWSHDQGGWSMMKELPENQVHALDVSEWGGEIKESQWKAAHDAGFRLAIVQAWGGGPVLGGKNQYCAQQLAGARKAGMMTAIYIWIPPDDTTRTEFLIQAAKDAAGSEYQHIKFVAMDIEGEKLLHPTDPKARLADAISHIQDKRVVIYTSRSMWGKVMDGAIELILPIECKVQVNQYPLWDARYDKIADLDMNWVPYGGWKERAIKQYQGTTTVAGGISADLNVVHLGWLFPSPKPDPIQEALADIGRAKNTLKTGYELAMRHLDEAEEHLIE